MQAPHWRARSSDPRHRALVPEMVIRIDQAVSAFDAVSHDNDPYGEHSFGTGQVEGQVVVFEFDYFDLDLQYAPPDQRAYKAQEPRRLKALQTAKELTPV